MKNDEYCEATIGLDSPTALRFAVFYQVDPDLEDVVSMVEDAIKSVSYGTTNDRPPASTTPIRLTLGGGFDPGESIASRINEIVSSCLGAVAVLNEMTHNIAYEIGLTHGMGKRVLILKDNKTTMSQLWSNLTNIAGSVVETYSDDLQSIKKPVVAFVQQTIKSMGKQSLDIARLPSYPMPMPMKIDQTGEEFMRKNLLKSFLSSSDSVDGKSGPWGTVLRVNAWEPKDSHINIAASSNTRWVVILRALQGVPMYSFYFHVKLENKTAREPVFVWLGITSRLKPIGLYADERLGSAAFLADTKWCVLTGTFAELLERGYLCNTSVFGIDQIRFRCGEIEEDSPIPYEVGYIGFI